MKLFAKKKAPPQVAADHQGSSSAEPKPKASALDQVLSDDILNVPLEQLNSKQRRLLRRKLQREPEGDRAPKAEGLTKVVTEGDTEAADKSDLHLKSLDARAKEKLLKKLARPGGVNAPPVQTPKKVKDLSHLPPEERKRREEQRQKQMEAKERRDAAIAAGEDPNARHPLNSERRRANKRKPSEGMKAAAKKKAKKEQRDEFSKQNWNRGGFDIRKGKGKPGNKDDVQPNDWSCSKCGCNNFARNTACFKCGKAGKGDGKNKFVTRAGDWPCPACGCNNFAYKTECFKCGKKK